VSAPKYDVGVVRTLSAAMGRPANTHDYVVTDTRTGSVKGIYATQEMATAALLQHAQPGSLYVMTVVHPAACRCPAAP
jgi:hypothetical protein